MRFRRRTTRIVFAFFFLIAGVSGAVAQVGGSLSGTVKDESGGVIPGATVTAMNTGIGTMFTTVTEVDGTYTFPKLPVGRYDISIELEGFKVEKRTALAVDADAALQLNVTLMVGSQSETVSVTVNVPLSS